MSPVTPARTVSRRAFLARIGVLGAAAGVGGRLLLGPAASGAPAQVPDALRRLLAELARDTLNGLTTFVVPGPDRYSRAQGTPRSEPGALEAGATDFMIEALDNFVPFPQQVARPVAAALATGLSDLGIELPGNLLDLLPLPLDTLDEALTRLLEGDDAIPLSLVVALLLNLVATQVNPLAVSGPFLSPFARLRFAEKARAFALIEGPDADLVALLDTELPEPLRASVSGLLRFVGGALIEFPAFGAYNERAVYDPGSRTLTGTPVGWTLTGYGGVSDGWDDFRGYYQDRTEVSD
ncbi:MAG TPA: twin-arginine translocation signal domain-containing protein [Acidimicrobiales bacterium]